MRRLILAGQGAGCCRPQWLRTNWLMARWTCITTPPARAERDSVPWSGFTDLPKGFHPHLDVKIKTFRSSCDGQHQSQRE